jgi:hypothetical protein
MTNPVARGYPDWFPQYGGLDQEFLNVSAATINGTKVWGPFYLGNRRRIGVRFANLDHVGTIDFTAYRDAAGTQPLVGSSFNLNVGMSFERSVACPGPYIAISVLSPAATTLTYDLRVWQTDVPFDHREVVQDAVLVSNIKTAINATTTVNPTASNHHVGEVHWTAYCTGPNWEAELRTVQLDGTSKVLDRGTNVEGRISRFAFLAYGYGLIRVINNDVAAQTYDAILVAQPDPGH